MHALFFFKLGGILSLSRFLHYGISSNLRGRQASTYAEDQIGVTSIFKYDEYGAKATTVRLIGD